MKTLTSNQTVFWAHVLRLRQNDALGASLRALHFAYERMIGRAVRAIDVLDSMYASRL